MSSKKLRRAIDYLEKGAVDPARHVLESVIQQEPDNAQAHYLLCGVALAKQDLRSACRHALDAAAAQHGLDELGLDIVHVLIRLGECQAARSLLGQNDTDHFNSALPIARLASAYQLLHMHHDALKVISKAQAFIQLTPDQLYYSAIQMNFCGQIAESVKILASLADTGYGVGRAYLILARSYNPDDYPDFLGLLAKRLIAMPPASEHAAAILFAQFHELHRLGRHQDAWRALCAANTIMHRLLGYDAAREQRIVTSLKTSFAELARVHRPAPVKASPVPIFIVGLPRSGTTLLERLLTNHSDVASAGELTDFGKQLRWAANRLGASLLDEPLIEAIAQIDCTALGQRYMQQASWHARNKGCFVDKQPANFWLLGLIRLALPQAKIIHLRRAPLDVCFSNYKAMFGDSYEYSYDLASLAAHYVHHCDLMNYWRRSLQGAFLDVDYEDLVRDTAGSMQRILDYCQLPLDPACLDATRNAAPVATLSSSQVRKPIHTQSIEEWQPYASELSGLRLAIEQARH